MFMTSSLYRKTVKDLVDELRTRFLVAGRAIVGVHPYHRPQDEGSWGEIEVHYQGNDCILTGSTPEFKEPERIIWDHIQLIRSIVEGPREIGKKERLRVYTQQLERDWAAHRRGELRSVELPSPF